MLSSNALEALAASTAPSYTMGDKARRAAGREAVRAAAEELGLDPLAPSLPRFGAGEDVLRAAALRVLTVSGLEKTLEKHRARVAACEAAAARIAELERRAAELQRVELGRMDDQIKAGKDPGPAPAEARAESDAIDRALRLVGAQSGQIRGWVHANERGIILEAVSTPALLASVVFYGELVVQRLRLLTENEHYNAPAARTTQLAAAEVAQLVKRSRTWSAPRRRETSGSPPGSGSPSCPGP